MLDLTTASLSAELLVIPGRGGGLQTGRETGDCCGCWTGGDRGWPVGHERQPSGQESGCNAVMEPH
jgi:hypothetical protein